jgi:hypothetical protein
MLEIQHFNNYFRLPAAPLDDGSPDAQRQGFFDGANGACSSSHPAKKPVAYNAGLTIPFTGTLGSPKVLPAAPL